jgi:two-component system OmpR family sensor kinase
MQRFTADASHELRGPLATMRSTIDVSLSRPRRSAEYRETLASVGEDVDRLRAITEDLLVLARADVGRMPLDRQPVRLDVIAGEVLESFLATAAERGVSLGVERAEPVLVEGDERWLRQLVFNLLDNAVKFSADATAGARAAAVSLSVARDAGTATLRVADTGSGIPDRALPRLFERFFRADEARPYRGREGFGLGLAIAAWVAEAHGGRITAANRPGGGSVFSVSLPLSRART